MNSKNFFNKVFSLNSIFLVSVLSTCLFFILKTLIFTNYDSPIGDEIYFLKVFEEIDKNGFFNAWASGNFSPLYYLICYPLDALINNPLLSFRIVSSLCTIISILLIYFFAKNRLNLGSIYVKSILIFSVSFLASRIYWQGINDSLFHLLVIISFFHIHNIYFRKNIKYNLILLGLVLASLIGTRLLAILILPCYICFFFKNLKQGFLVGGITIFVGVLFHLPSLYSSQTFCSINKNPSNEFTWAQKNYLSQQYIYEGKIKDGYRVTWAELGSYIKENGANKLPYSFFESVFFKPSWTIKEFFNDFWFSFTHIYFPFLSLGVFVLIGFLFFTYKKSYLLTKQLKLSKGFIGFFLMYTSFISFIILGKIEFRWYTSLIYLAIVFSHLIIQDYRLLFNTKKQILFIKLNLILLVFFQLSFILMDNNPLRRLAINYIKANYLI